ncbi:unnamed protein product [Rotaria sp. Silwood1]|nr:unnamed protein product [Rotaria sp. Silwood1]
MDYQHIKFFINLIENYYPELLGQVIILNAPWIFYGCWTIISKWLNPTLRDEIRFVKNEVELAQHIDPSALPRRLNGTQPDFEYIGPTANDDAMIATIRVDAQGKAKAQEAHQEAVRHYLNITLQWTRGDNNPNLLAERAMATKQLRNAFEKLVPYISTRTHYHRIGAIKEQIFQGTYNQIRASMANQV